MTEQEIRERIRAFLLDVFHLIDPLQLTDDVSLIGSGIVDSTGLLDIILFIEGEFHVEVSDTEATPGNLESIARIAQFVHRKLVEVARR